jgi:hypothetical protein
MTTLSRLRLVLGLSLALNLFVAGYLAARHWGGPAGAGDPLLMGGDAERPLRRLFQAMPEADAAVLRAALQARRPTLREMVQGQRAAMVTVRAEIARPVLDEAALAEAMRAAQAGRGRMVETLAALLREVVPHLSPEGRSALAGFRELP